MNKVMGERPVLTLSEKLDDEKLHPIDVRENAECAADGSPADRLQKVFAVPVFAVSLFLFAKNYAVLF